MLNGICEYDIFIDALSQNTAGVSVLRNIFWRVNCNG